MPLIENEGLMQVDPRYSNPVTARAVRAETVAHLDERATLRLMAWAVGSIAAACFMLSALAMASEQSPPAIASAPSYALASGD